MAKASTSERAAPPPYVRSPSSTNYQEEANLLISSYLPTYTASSPPVYDTSPAGPPSRQVQLPVPLCLPQTSSKPDSGFLRGYSSVLGDLGVERGSWLNFLDGLNLAMSDTASFRTANVIGDTLTVIPVVGFAGLAIKSVAHRTNAKSTKSVVERYLQAANDTLFAHSALTVRLLKTHVLQRLTGLDSTATGPNKVQAMGRTAANVWMRLPLPTLGPIVSAGIRAGVNYSDKKGKGKAIAEETRLEMEGPIIIQTPGSEILIPPKVLTQLETFRGYILPIEVDLPPPVPPKGLMDRWNTFIVKNDQARKQREWEVDEVIKLSRTVDLDGARINKELRRKWGADDTIWLVLTARDQAPAILRVAESVQTENAPQQIELSEYLPEKVRVQEEAQEDAEGTGVSSKDV